MNITAFIAFLIAGILSTIGIVRGHSPVKIHALPKKEVQTVTITVTPTPKPMDNEGNISPTPYTNPTTNFDIENFVYPGSTKTNSSSSSVTLESGDDPSAISSWYQQKVNSLSMGAKSIVNTKTNGNVNDIIDAANNTTEVKITILKNSTDAQTTITVTISSHASSENGSGTSNVKIYNNINSSSDTSNTY